ncbi:TetR/AcrR family transcriptional regulator [Streptomyces sp. NPDC059740]|uniref:TetR/AcrR family transcriptional regulator n=1 Tax=Streptomyces sp. NPDC059740 TaxID=3346926 RepID=UPI00364F8A25
MTGSDALVGVRSRLLAAARVEFAAHGMGGARVARIAEQAGVSKERIYGHFGNKEKLFEAVVSETLREHAELLGPPSGDLGEYAGRIHDLHQRNPELLRLMMWEALHFGTAALPAARERTARYQEMVGVLADALGPWADGRAAGTLLALLGIAILPSAFPQITGLILGTEPGGEGGMRGEELRAGIVDLARRMTGTGAAGTDLAPA